MLVVMSNEHFDLSGRRALVTGASRGIGRAIAFGLASAGADVALAARDKERLTEIAVGIRDLGRNACVVPLDVSKLDTVGPAIDAAAAGLGGLDVLVNNAGVNGPGGFDVMDDREFDRVLDTNFGGVLFACEAARPYLADAENSVIINMGSIAATKGVDIYGASKAAVHSMTRGMSREFAVDGIRCVAVAPGQVETDMTAHVRADPERLQQMLAHTARGRVATPEEIAATVVYLASPAADFVSGAVLAIDGGRDFFSVQ